MKSIDKDDFNSGTNRNHSPSLTSEIIPVTPEMIEAGLDVFNNIIELHRDIVDLFHEMERTKQIRIDAETRIQEAQIQYNSHFLDFTTKMAELKNQHDLIEQRGEIIKKTNERCDILLNVITEIARLKISDNQIEQAWISQRLKLLLDKLDSIQISLTKL